MKKIHILSHHGHDVTNNNTKFKITRCGLRGNSYDTTENMKDVTCSRCKKLDVEFNDYINNIFEFKIGDVYEKEFNRKYEIKSISKILVTCYILNSDFTKVLKFPKNDKESKYEIITMKKSRIVCYTKLNKGATK